MISVITITYNNFDQLKETLSSIPNFSFVESIVIDGGDCQKTKEYLKHYAGKSISEKDNGIADAFNKGISISTGKYIMFLNSGDVLIDKNYLLNAFNILENNPEYDFVHSNILLVDENLNEFYMRPQMKSLGRGMPYLHPTMIVKKTIFDQIGYFNTKINISIDFDWVVRLVKNNYKGYYLNENAVVKMDGSGISVTNELYAIKECFEILKYHRVLSIRNLFGFSIRFFLYLIRDLIVKINLKKFLIFMKRLKHSK